MTTIQFEGNYCKNTIYGWALTLTSAWLVERLCLQLSVCQPSYGVFTLWFFRHRHPMTRWGKQGPLGDVTFHG